MKGMIVINAYTRNPSLDYNVRRLTEEFEKKNVKVDVVSAAALTEIKDGKAAAKHTPDFCVFLDKDKYAANALEKCGVRLFNSARSIELCDDKMLTHIFLSGLRMPDTIPAPLCFTDAEPDGEFLKKVKTLGFPLVGKESYGSMGEQVRLIKDESELLSVEKRLMKKPHFYQKFINAGGKDVRVTVVGGKAICAYMRSNDADFRSNLARGAKAIAYEPSEKIISLAEEAASRLGLDYCGVDIFPCDPPVLCEVNSNAFFVGTEKTTGVNVARAYVEHILDCIKG